MTNEIEHSGILGMKWGLRRFQFSDGTYTALGKARRRIGSGRSADNERYKAKQDERQAVRDRRIMSDEELDARIKRLEKEKKLKELTENDLSAGKKFVKGVMSDSGKKIASTLLTGAVLYAVKTKTAGEKMSAKGFSEHVFKEKDKSKEKDKNKDIFDEITGGVSSELGSNKKKKKNK